MTPRASVGHGATEGLSHRGTERTEAFTRGCHRGTETTVIFGLATETQSARRLSLQGMPQRHRDHRDFRVSHRDTERTEAFTRGCHRGTETRGGGVSHKGTERTEAFTRGCHRSSENTEAGCDVSRLLKYDVIPGVPGFSGQSFSSRNGGDADVHEATPRVATMSGFSGRSRTARKRVARLFRLIRASFEASHGIYRAPRVVLNPHKGERPAASIVWLGKCGKRNLRALHGYHPQRGDDAGAARRFTSIGAPSTAATCGDDFCRADHLEPSISRSSNCWENAVAESFFSSLTKSNKQIYKYRQLATGDVANHIESLLQSNASPQSSRRAESRAIRTRLQAAASGSP